MSSNTQSKGLPPSSSSSSSSSISLNVHSVRKSPSVDTSASKSGNPLRELSNFRIDDLVNGGGLQSSALRSSVNCVASLPLLKTCSGPTDSMRCPLTNLMYGGYAPELPDKCQDSTARSCGHFGLLHQQQPSHCQNGDDFVLKKELQKACR